MTPDDIHAIVRILKREIRRWPVPALAKYVETPFTVLISCILSLRTQDRTTLAASDRLFAIATTPDSMLSVPVEKIERAIYPVSFYRTKARTIHVICELLLSRHGGNVPSDLDVLLGLPGVGRKTANVILNTIFGQPMIAVDTHIFRVSNRTNIAPGKDVRAVEDRLHKFVPEEFLVPAHHLLILHGRYVCKARVPECFRCVINDLCEYRDKNL